MIAGQKYLYQIGNADEDFYIFRWADFTASIPNGKKRVINTSALFNGESIGTGLGRFFKNAWKISVSFNEPVGSRFDHNYIQKILDKGVLKVFFVEKTLDNSYRVFFNYGIIANNSVQVIQPQTIKGLSYYQYAIELFISNPFFFECDEGLKYFSESGFENSTPLLIGEDWTLGDTVELGQEFAAAFPAFSSLELSKKLLAFETGTDQDRIPLYFQDRFIARDIYTLATSDLLTTTLSDNNLARLTSDAMKYNETTAANLNYLIEFSPLAQNEWIDIINTNNNSGIRFTWLSDVANPSNIIFNSFNGVFTDKATGLNLDYTKVNYDITETCSDFLFFSPLYSKNSFVGIVNGEDLTLQKNSTANNTISINLLKTFN